MDSAFIPKWMVQALGILLIIFLASLIINQLFCDKVSRQVLRVSGTGKIIAVPDLATVTIGVASEGNTPTLVRDSTNKKINQIISFIKLQNIAEKDIQTSGFFLSPKYDYSSAQNNQIGYQATQTVTVKIRAIDKSQQQLEKVLTGVVSNGANQIQGINFSFSNPDNFKQMIRKKAIKQAKNKAKELCEDAGIRLGRVLNIEESESSLPIPYPHAVAMSVKNQAVAPTIEAGTEELSETITLLFEVR